MFVVVTLVSGHYAAPKYAVALPAGEAGATATAAIATATAAIVATRTNAAIVPGLNSNSTAAGNSSSGNSTAGNSSSGNAGASGNSTSAAQQTTNSTTTGSSNSVAKPLTFTPTELIGCLLFGLVIGLSIPIAVRRGYTYFDNYKGKVDVHMLVGICALTFIGKFIIKLYLIFNKIGGSLAANIDIASTLMSVPGELCIVSVNYLKAYAVTLSSHGRFMINIFQATLVVINIIINIIRRVFMGVGNPNAAIVSTLLFASRVVLVFIDMAYVVYFVVVLLFTSFNNNFASRVIRRELIFLTVGTFLSMICLVLAYTSPNYNYFMDFSTFSFVPQMLFMEFFLSLKPVTPKKTDDDINHDTMAEDDYEESDGATAKESDRYSQPRVISTAAFEYKATDVNSPVVDPEHESTEALFRSPSETRSARKYML